jgi:hypothetical protein
MIQINYFNYPAFEAQAKTKQLLTPAGLSWVLA